MRYFSPSRYLDDGEGANHETNTIEKATASTLQWRARRKWNTLVVGISAMENLPQPSAKTPMIAIVCGSLEQRGRLYYGRFGGSLKVSVEVLSTEASITCHDSVGDRNKGVRFTLAAAFRPLKSQRYTEPKPPLPSSSSVIVTWPSGISSCSRLRRRLARRASAWESDMGAAPDSCNIERVVGASSKLGL